MLSRKLRVFRDTPNGVSSEKDCLVDENDLAEQLLGLLPKNLFLGLYSEEELTELLRCNGIFSELKKRGFHNILLNTKLKDNFEHVLRLYNAIDKPENLLVEIVVRKACLPLTNLPPGYRFNDNIEVLFVEWLQAQNPRDVPSNDKPLLPGQRHTGLGLATSMLNLLIIFAKRMNVFAIAAIPGHYHNAVIFSRYLKYLNPESEGRLLALKRDLALLELALLSWAVEFNCIQEKISSDYFKWFLDWQVFPVKRELRHYFSSKFYQERVTQVTRQYNFQLDQELFESKKEQIYRIKEAII